MRGHCLCDGDTQRGGKRGHQDLTRGASKRPGGRHNRFISAYEGVKERKVPFAVSHKNAAKKVCVRRYEKVHISVSRDVFDCKRALFFHGVRRFTERKGRQE